MSFEPTPAQDRALYILGRFLISDKPQCAMLLMGYAGTGKTTLMQALVKYLSRHRAPVVLLAPTGRAAKVLSSYTGRMAFTVHKHIYRRTVDGEGAMSFSLAVNQREHVLYIVDEASMLSDAPGMLRDGLLTDLIKFVYSAPGCRLVLLGDDAQLPPVGVSESPALDVDHMVSEYGLTMASTTLRDVVRQSADSAILDLATAIRARIFEKTPDLGPKIDYTPGPSVMHISSRDVAELLEQEYDAIGRDQVRVLCRSNKNANQYNHQIRNHIFQMDDQLCAGELLMVVRNNYLWLQDESKMPFIANGELCELLYIKDNAERYGYRFATLGLSFPDQEGEASFECKALLDVLDTESASMGEEPMREFYQQVRTDLTLEFGPSEARAKMPKDPWFNALQMKYGYAITCHKAQGGQWPVVFIDRGFLTEEMIDKDYWRWLYTAVTRATERLYLINF